MGLYRIEIEAVGGHGCKREIKSGEKSFGCGSLHCPDCMARLFVRILSMLLGNTVQKAKLTHWPGEQCEVQDDLLTGERTGNF